jgi:hypothetical protein
VVNLQLTDEGRDKYVAPGISSFTAASIRDMSESMKPWLLAFIPVSSLVVSLDDATRRIFHNFLRKAGAAFREYDAARVVTCAYLASSERKTSQYILAIDHWEGFLSLAWQAWNLLVRGQRVLYVKADGSVLERLNVLYNLTKHADSAIRHEPPQFLRDATLPVWLTNDGLHSVEGALSFTEIAEMLQELSLWADAAQNPLTMRETILAAYGGPPADSNTEEQATA